MDVSLTAAIFYLHIIVWLFNNLSVDMLKREPIHQSERFKMKFNFLS